MQCVLRRRLAAHTEVAAADGDGAAMGANERTHLVDGGRHGHLIDLNRIDLCDIVDDGARSRNEGRCREGADEQGCEEAMWDEHRVTAVCFRV